MISNDNFTATYLGSHVLEIINTYLATSYYYIGIVVYVVKLE